MSKKLVHWTYQLGWGVHFNNTMASLLTKFMYIIYLVVAVLDRSDQCIFHPGTVEIISISLYLSLKVLFSIEEFSQFIIIDLLVGFTYKIWTSHNHFLPAGLSQISLPYIEVMLTSKTLFALFAFNFLLYLCVLQYDQSNMRYCSGCSRFLWNLT